ncbi:protein pellino-like [Diaphorina citri]|uniref:Protein pellino-like n=1 Tax=Diaphorina citri TaxID=121845 RepID=A0A3Q0JDQ1_DIACI|nr:protein pellino-like [Diaphorina citri]
MASTISRFACRILCNRKTLECRVFAAGFDSSSNIFLGEKATKWQEQHEMIDGLTTNGILLMHPPNGSFSYNGENQQPPMWREVSVGGGIFSVRETRSAPQKGVQVS